MSSSSDEIERFGLTEIYTCENPSADIVFVHGLNGHPQRTWTSQKTDIFWPRDLLPTDCADNPGCNSRVLVYGYDADVTGSAQDGGTSKDRIHNHAELLVAYLVANRRRQRAESRPIVFVAHSLGGLVVKRALIYSSSVEVGSKTERLRSVFLSTCGIVFMGTPHHGSDLAVWGSYLERLAGAIIPRKILDTSDQLVEALKRDSETLVNIDRGFAQFQDRFNIYYFHEAKKTDVKGTLKFVVDEESAAPTQPNVQRAGIQADHSHMCKFDGEGSPGYILVSGAITDDITDELEKGPVAHAWALERRTRQFLLGNRAPALGAASAPVISEPSSRQSSPGNLEIEPKYSGQRLLEQGPVKSFFFVPHGFRENAFFVGMHMQLEAIDVHLLDLHRRSKGTASVLLHGAPGAGKSHLARQYIYANRSKFPGGVFWINARHPDETESDLWQIAQDFVAHDSPSIRIEPSGKGKHFIQAVREWFASRDNWLIVLDGVVVDTRDDAERLQKIVPDQPNCSLIYTSRSSQFHVSHKLMHPRPVKVPPLSGTNGAELLLKEASIPVTSENKAAALTIVRKVGGLPLAIHAISHRLAQTHERLETYRLRSYADDPKLGGPFHEIMNELLVNHRPAYNLMNILAFFGPHIPVEMIRWGSRALRSSGLVVKSTVGYSSAPEINNSLSILIRNALVERNEPEDIDSATSSKSSLTDPEPMDVLRLHSVVQKFCRDRLSISGRDHQAALPQWFDIASRAFAQSYATAKEKMNERQHEYHPRVSDYREYLKHAQRMREFSITYEHRGQSLAGIRSRIDELLKDVSGEIDQHEPKSSVSSVIVDESGPSIFDRISAASSSSQLSEDDPSTPEDQVPPGAPWNRWWSQDEGRPVLTSPVDARFPTEDRSRPLPGDESERVRAIDMLRSLSDRTIRQSAVSNDITEMSKPAKHVKSGSQPAFQRTESPTPSLAHPDTSILAKGEFARDADSPSSVPSAYSGAVPRLAHLFRNGPSSPLGETERPLLTDSPRSVGLQNHPFTSSKGPQLLRTPSSPQTAPPMVTRNPPNPRTNPYYPNSFISPYMYNNVYSDHLVSTIPIVPFNPVYYGPHGQYKPPYANQEIPRHTDQPMELIPASYTMSSTSRKFNDMEHLMNQAAFNHNGIVPASLDARLHNDETSQQVSNATTLQDGIEFRHGRAASVPNIDADPFRTHQIDSPRRASAVSSPIGWAPIYYQPTPMVREASIQSGSSGQGSIIQSASVTQQVSNFPQTPRPATQAASIMPYSSSPPVQSTQRTSPLQAVQMAEELQQNQQIPFSRSSMAIKLDHPTPPPPAAPFPGDLQTSKPRSAPPTSSIPPISSLTSADPSSSRLPSRQIYSALVPSVAVGSPTSASPPIAAAMSRASSGPGIAVRDPGRGLGIAEFGSSDFNVLEAGSVTFGEHLPIDLNEARRRSLVHETRLRQEPQQSDYGMTHHTQTRWGSRSELAPSISPDKWELTPAGYGNTLPTISGPAPYPDINQIPADTSARELQAMVDQCEKSPEQPSSETSCKRRSRGMSEPQWDNWSSFAGGSRT